MDYQDYDDIEDDEEENEENERENQNTNERNKTKVKHKNKTKVKYKKSKPKKKIVYRDRTHTNGFLMFFLFLIILLLIAVIGYLVYVNYYEKDDKTSNNTGISNNSVKTTDNTPKMCESNTTVYTLDLGLNKCSSSNEFKLNVKGTHFSFTIERVDDQYKIVNAFYDDSSIYPKLLNISFDSMKIKKIDNVYFIWIKGETEYLSGIYNGSVNYESNGYEYNIGSDITYDIYPNGEKNECSYYKENNLLDNTLYTKVKLNISNGNITEEKTNVLVKDECS